MRSNIERAIYRYLRLLVAFCGLWFATPAQAITYCEYRLNGPTPIDFTKTEFKIEETLSGGVYLIRARNGAKHVLRSAPYSADFEVFASRFLNTAPGVISPQARKLNAEENEFVVQYLQQNVGPYINSDVRYTVVDFFEGVMGNKHLEQIGFSAPDISGLSPEQRMEWITSRLHQLPAKLITELADAWAIYTTLGISDYHSKNWLVSDDHVVSIDMANFKYHLEYDAKTVIELPGQQMPFETLPINDEIRDYLLKHVSEDMRDFLKNVSVGQIKNLAQEAGLFLTLPVMQDMVARAHAIANADPQKSYPESLTQAGQ